MFLYYWYRHSKYYMYLVLCVNKKHVLNRRFKRVLNRFKHRIKNRKKQETYIYTYIYLIVNI